MPSEHTDPDVLHPSTPLLTQIKLCATCLSPLTQLHDQLDPAPLVCPPCRERTTRAAKQLADAALLSTVDVSVHLEGDQFASSFGPRATTTTTTTATTISTAVTSIPQPQPLLFRSASPTPTSISDNDTNTPSITLVTPPLSPSSLLHIHTVLPSPSPTPSPSQQQQQQQQQTTTPLPTPALPSPSTSFLAAPKDPDPDPLCDITRLRVKSQSQDCLYPGAQFCGTQKSGRSSYEVSVTIVDVDFTSSFLCGYLRIRGLTDDWPELTTYFDAQIIGTQYGFLTDAWGASEAQDMTHWDRFSAFHRVRGDIRGPKLLLRDPPKGENRGCVFMRWKERFLVPDHRVRDINGASFAGFYYVCVEYSPQAHSPSSSTCSSTSSVSSSASSEESTSSIPLLEEHECVCDTATMSGFYFHQNSEPYQQLSLRHVPRESTGVFEFR